MMIIDKDTNKLFLADCLPKKQPKFFPRFEKVLKDCNLDYEFLPGTKDTWAVDYMPVQVSKDKFVQFNYYPTYLRTPYWRKTISDADAICKAISLKPVKSDLFVDGGNVIRSEDKVIMCDKVFSENNNITKNTLIRQLEELLEVDKIVFVPWDKNDFTGHADGMVRFIDNNTVFVNDYSKENAGFQKRFRTSIHEAGLDCVELPYNLDYNKSDDEANGIYMNFLQMNGFIIVPIFGIKEDEEAVKIMEQVFKGQNIATIESNELAYEGGILNCISWNILKN